MADYVLKEGETEAKQINPAKSSAEQLAAWCGGIAGKGGMADAYLTLPDGSVAKCGDWIVRKADGSVYVEPCTEPLEGYAAAETVATEAEPAPAADPPVGTTYGQQQT